MDKNIRRGIDLQNRLWETKVGKGVRSAATWWGGGPIDRITFAGFFIVFIFNFIIVSSLFGKDLTPAFLNSSFLIGIANFFEKIGISKIYFFSAISILALSFAPINVYLFVRRNVHRHELTAFIATTIFVLPSPISKDGSPLITGLISGDGAHVLVFSFLPLYLLYFRAFVEKGPFIWGFFSALATSIIVIISPFSFLNLLVFYFIITASEGFMGKFRIKAARVLFVLVAAFGLSYFWYYPSRITQILLLESVNFSISYFWKYLPIMIPVLPVVGAISFLVFDRREKLQPVFMAASLFLAYLSIYYSLLSFSDNPLLPERFLPELVFSMAFVIALIFGFIFDLYFHRIKKIIAEKNKKELIILSLLFIISLVIFILFLTALFNIGSIREAISDANVIHTKIIGVGSVSRGTLFPDFSSVLAAIVSILTFVALVFIQKKMPLYYHNGEKK